MKHGARYALAVLGAGVVVALALLLPVSQWTLLLADWIRGAGVSGVAVYSVAYVLATLLFLPGSLLTAGAGFAYGPLWGTLLVSPVSVTASALPFVLARSVARRSVSRRVAGNSRFAAIDGAIGSGGFKIVLLLRLSPILPFNLLNYALGLTPIRLRDYILASALGMLPGTLLYVYLGSLVTSTSELLSGTRPTGGSGLVLYWGGLLSTVVATIFITRTAQRELRRVIEPQRPSGLPTGKEARS